MEAVFKQYFWVVKALGVGASAALAASAATTYFGTSLIYDKPATAEVEASTDTDGEEEDDDEPARSAPAANPAASRGPTPSDRAKVAQSILALNLFCPTCTKLVQNPEGPGQVAPPDLGPGELPKVAGKQPGEGPCTLPLRLIATMETNMAEYSWATVRDEEDGSVGPYWPGDRIRPGVYLVSVESNLVHVKNNSTLEYIELGVEPPKPQPKTAKPVEKKKEEAPAAGGLEGAEDAIKCDTENTCTVKREFVEGLFANPASLAKQARVMPSGKDGETKGFKFYGIRPGSLPKLLGMKNGDLLTSVNGTELKSVDQVMGLLTKLRRASNLSVTIERKGETITKDITIQ